MSAASDWIALRDRLVDLAAGTKDGQSIVVGLAKAYGELSAADRREVDDVISEWILSDDLMKRFDALAVVAHHAIPTVVPALRELARQLESDDRPVAPYEWDHVNGLLGQQLRST